MRDEVLEVRFGSYMVAEVHQKFWEAMARGEFITDAAQGAGSYRKQGARWLVACGGIRPRRGRNLKGRCLTFAEREEIALLRSRRQGRAPDRSRGRPLTRRRSAGSCAAMQTPAGGYRASTAHAAAYERASRPKEAKLVTNLALRERVEADLDQKYSPEQIAGRLRREFPDDPEMQVHHETIYQALYLQSRGALRRELTRRLRTGRSVRKPGRRPASARTASRTWSTSRSVRAEADDRAVPGHWEGDLIIGQAATLRRSGRWSSAPPATRCWCTCPTGTRPSCRATALARKIQTLPEVLRTSLTWDQGTEMRDWKHVKLRRRHRRLLLRPALTVATRQQ